MTNLIHIHIGDSLPTYIYDSIYQTMLVSPHTKIYVILNDSNIESFRKTISQFNLNIYLEHPIHPSFQVECIPLSILKIPNEYIQFVNNLPESTKNFRDSFWISTSARFFYIESLMELFKLKDVYHIENDIMIYEDLGVIPVDKNKMYMVKDSVNRVIPSILYFPDSTHLHRLTTYMLAVLNHFRTLVNDMQLLGTYFADHVEYFPFDFSCNQSFHSFLMDGAAIGQFIGGIDPRNIPEYNHKNKIEQQLLIMNNPTKGFINEASTFKPDSVSISKKDVYLKNVTVPVKLFYCNNNATEKKIVNLHMHSKQLYQTSSLNQLLFNDLITTERIANGCDVDVKDVKDLSVFKEIYKKTIKLFIYSQNLDLFIDSILPHLDSSKEYVLYVGGIHEIHQRHVNFLTSLSCIKKVYAAHPIHPTFHLLPIGVKDPLSMYSIISQTYYKNKTNSLYTSDNQNNDNKSYEDYLRELSTYRFCLCNNYNDYRIWECYYLGVIPVIKKNTTYLNHLKNLKLPFYAWNDQPSDFFTEELYKKTMTSHSSPYNIDSIRLSFYE